jgi:transcriptional regulator with XRE-family HTH domain
VPQAISPSQLRDLFRERGLTFDAVAVLAGVETSTVSRWVNGQMGATPEAIVRLARGLGISAKRLQAMIPAGTVRDDDQALSA